MTWNYRLIDFGEHKAVHEVHYDEFGKPNGWSESPATFVGDAEDSPLDFARSLSRALSDTVNRPILYVQGKDLVEEKP